MNLKNRSNLFFEFIFTCLLLLNIPAAAQDTKLLSNSPVTHIDLGVTALTLKPGESYEFHITYEPADPDITTLNWYVTDERVVQIDPMDAVVTALAEGEAQIFAQSMNGFSHAVCSVTVGTSAAKDITVMKSGSDLLGLSARDMKKITARSLLDYISFLSDAWLNADSLENVTPRWFDVVAAVRPGKETKQSELARSLGVEESYPLPDLHGVTLAGQFDAILAYIKDNPDLVSVYEFGPVWIDDPIPEELDSGSIGKAIGLQGAVEGLTDVRVAHDLGLTGKGRTIAVMDTGLDYKHEQFKGKDGKSRVIYEACFSGAGSNRGKQYMSVCENGSTEAGSSAAFDAYDRRDFNHGAHVTGIAAGKNGIAPDASIISVQIFSQVVWNCNGNELQKFSCGGNHANQCCSSTALNSSSARAYQYLIDLMKKGVKIDAVNLSIGGNTGYAGVCDEYHSQKKNYFDALREAGALPVVAAGNESLTEQLVEPACLSNAYVVGGLMDDAGNDPRIRNSSNHHKNVDITAPGTNVYSAYFEPKSNESMGIMSGTSMATPVVTGAIALVKQLYPGMSPQDAGRFLQEISTKTVFARWNGQSFSYKKPILTFTNILKGFSIPDDRITASGQTVTVTIDRIMKTSKYMVNVIDLSDPNNPTVTVKTETKPSGNFTNLTITGEFKEGHVYRLETTRYLQKKEQDNPVTSQTVNYFTPFSKAITVSAVPLDTRAHLTAYPGNTFKDKGIQYIVTDAETNAVVIRFNVDQGSNLLNLSGFVNGHLYNVVAKPYRKVTINRKSYTLWGGESKPVSFIPLSAPLYSKISWDGSGDAVITCPADPAANGIRVLYRTKNGKLLDGCKSEPGKFTCPIKNLDPKGSYQFYVMKYKTVKEIAGYSSGVVINRNFPEAKLEGPGKIHIYTENGKTTVYSLYSEKDKNGISVLKLNRDKFDPFCERPEYTCSPDMAVSADTQGMYYIMNYLDSNGTKTYSDGFFVNNNFIN